MLSQLELEFTQIKYRWRTHSELFGEDEKVGLLNRCGGKVFGLLQVLLVNDTLAALCRLCDPAKSVGQENNSILNQYKKRKANLSSSDIKEIDNLLALLEFKLKSIRHLRNKAISHNDLGVAENAIKLPDVTYDEIDEVIDLIPNILNRIFGVSGNYSSVTAFGPGVDTLLNILKAGEEKPNG